MYMYVRTILSIASLLGYIPRCVSLYQHEKKKGATMLVVHHMSANNNYKKRNSNNFLNLREYPKNLAFVEKHLGKK